MNCLIKNGKLVTNENQLGNGEIWIRDGKIHAIGQEFEQKLADFEEVYDVQGGVIFPGWIDVHVHFREPGFEEKETIRTGSLAAAHGGFTQVCMMPNVAPTPDTSKEMRCMIERIKKEAVVKVHPYAPITKNRTSEEELVNFSALKEAGAWAFSNDGSGIQTAGTMFAAMLAAKKVGLPIVAHAEENSLLHGGVMREGKRSVELGVPGMRSIVESSQVARDVLLSKEAGCHYHVCHVSSKETVQIIRLAKKNGIHVTCEVTPHHLLLTDEAVPENSAMWKMNPPLASKEDREALLEGLFDGTIDMIATDHAPHTMKEKETTFAEGAFGIVGLEQAFSLLYTQLVCKGIATLEQLIGWLSKAPAKVFQLEGGSLEVGQPADITVMNLEKEFVIDATNFESKGKNTPFVGQKVRGQTVVTFVDGKSVWKSDGC